MLELIATSTSGLETVVFHELKRLGYTPRNSDVEAGRTFFQGEFSDLVKANVWLRSAGKVLIKLSEFDVYNDFDAIFEAVKEIPWEDWAPKDAKFIVDGRSVRSKITSVPALQRTVKKAIVERLCHVWHLTSLPETGAEYNIEISLHKDRATITLNSTGRGLHRRGYRLLNVAAPLRETLASALIQLSVWRPGRPLIDPFCASGTIPIEAAMLARNIAPGLNRKFAAQNWSVIPERLWDEARDEARAAILPPLEEKIHGSDIDEDALKIARKHAQLAGVEKDVVFYARDFRDLTDSREYGCIIGNPPYGDRIGEIRELRSLYESIPAVLSKLPTWSHYILTNWLDLEEMFDQKATRRRKLYNGRMECLFYQFIGPSPPRRQPNETNTDATTTNGAGFPLGNADAPTPVEQKTESLFSENADGQRQPLIVPVFQGLDDYAERQATEFGRCLANRARHLRRYPNRGITCYRLYDRDLPEVPLVIDFFEGQWLHIAEYERPDGRKPGQHRLWLDKMVQKAAEVLAVPQENVFLKRRARQSGESQYEKMAESGRVVRVHEGGLTFLCNMTDYLDVGLFLDHRQTRDMVRKEAKNKRFLNLFCYSGAFTCYAADGGAASTTSVDLSPTYLDWCESNLAANDLLYSSQIRHSDGTVTKQACNHRLIKSDVIRFLKAVPPSTDYSPDIVRLIEETAAEVGETKKRAHYAKSSSKLNSRKQYFKNRDGKKFERGALPSQAFGVTESNFELCVCDPPTFSNSKSTDSDWDVQRRHVELLRLLATRMRRGGVVYFSNNFRKFKLDEEGLADLYELREITNRTIPDDFRNKRIHRCWRMIVK